MKRLIKCVLLGLILGVVLSLGITKYQTDQNEIYYRIAQIQRQQEMLSIFTTDVVMEKLLYSLKLQNRTIIVLGDLVDIVEDMGNPLPALIEKASQSVVYVVAQGQWSGSGVIIGPHTVLTARHVVQDALSLEIETADGKTHKVISWVEDEDNDCALIFFDPREEFDSVAEFADSDKLRIGEVIFTIGSPYGKELFNTTTLGIISGLDRDIPYFGTCGLITSDAAGNPGNSGGPVFDTQGKVIGIIVGTYYGAEGLNILIPANICRELLEKEI